HNAHGFIQFFNGSVMKIRSREGDIPQTGNAPHILIRFILRMFVASRILRELILLFQFLIGEHGKLLIEPGPRGKGWTAKVHTAVTSNTTSAFESLKTFLLQFRQRALVTLHEAIKGTVRRDQSSFIGG